MDLLKELGLCGDDRWPSSHATHIERRHLPSLAASEYMVSDKTDGTRGLLVFAKNGRVALVDRIFRSFPVCVSGGDVPKATVLDGEMVTLFGNSRAFLVYDALMADDDPKISEKRLEVRLRAANKAIEGLEFTANDSPLYVGVKVMDSAANIRKYVADYVPGLPYTTDGIVLTPVREPVRPGTSAGLLKWKPADKITVDFMIDGSGTSAHDLYVMDKNKPRCVATSVWRGMDMMCASAALEARDYAVLECKLKKGVWRPVKCRRDKDRPNSYFVYQNTLKNIRENIALQEIIDVFDKND